MNNEERPSFHWKTDIAWKNKERIVIRGYDVNELTGNIDFGAMCHLVLCGELPTPEAAAMTNAWMVNLAEHAMSPSSATIRFATSGGADINAAMASGVAAIGKLHGTSDRPAEMFLGVEARAKEEDLSIEEAALRTVREMRERRESMSGYHHPQHIEDPRKVRILGLAKELGVAGKYCDIAQAMEDATVEVFKGRRLYLNGPGSMACTGLDVGYEPIQLKAIFIVARSLGLAAHHIEEASREKGWRASGNAGMIQPLSLEMQGPDWYDGPADRSLPTKD